MRTREKQRGSAMVEFAIAGIAGTTLLVSTVQLGLAMWNYHTMAEAVHETNRYIASHGRSCTVGGNNCAITVGQIATKLKTYAVGIPDTTINMTLTSQSGTTKVCNPISSFESDGTQWPPSNNFDNSPGNYTTITAKITVNSAIVALWYGTAGQRISSVTLPSTSSVPIVF
jgi:hypothetical protein